MLLVLLALWVAQEASPTPLTPPTPPGQPVPPEGPAPSVYAGWENGPPTDPAWFPIGVWLQEPELAEAYRALGVNTYVGLWQGPTRAQLARLARAGMAVVCAQNEMALENAGRAGIIAWMHRDEPDNRAPDRSGPAVPPAGIRRAYERLTAADPTRPVFLNLGQGVANDHWVGRGARPEQYPAYVAATDVVSFDVYPVTNIRRDDGEDFLGLVAKGVQRLRDWGGDAKPVWNFVECTRGPQPVKRPTPEQVEAEVWLGLVAGSRGIVYFCHEFEPVVNPDALLEDELMCRALTRVNLEVLGWAPVLNGPTLGGRVEVECAPGGARLATLLKEHEGSLYLFCIGTRNEPVRARIRLAGLPARSGGAVLGEDREVTLVAGCFEETFGPYQRRIYRFALTGPGGGPAGAR